MIRKEPVGFYDPDLIPWLPEAGIEGLLSKTLARCEATGSYTRLLKFLPGTDTSVAGPQSHDHLEELWIVEGAIHDLTLDQNFIAGMYANRLHHMDHGPWRAPGGAITYELRDNDPEAGIKKQQLEFFDPALVEWDGIDTDAGVFVKTLTSCQDTGSYGRLVKFHPGSSKPSEVEGEMGRSELWIVSGELVGLDSGGVHPAGTYGNVDLDLLDGRWGSNSGCVVFEVRNLI
ncbi:MAG: cupin domain-containing protein [Acidimicrobiia bacterium]